MSKKKIPEVQSLESVSLREVWPYEDSDFTPWLVNNIQLLGTTLDLNLDLESVQEQKTLKGGGRVDIYARQAKTGAIIVIENQLGESDNSHCLRLLGYAAHATDSGAEILVWVAKEFSPYHQRILKWLNKADTIDVYAVVVRAYRVGEALAFKFQLIVDPSQSRDGTPPNKKPASTPYAEFYRPLVEQLRRQGIRPSAWRGRYRSFHTGISKGDYGTQVTDEGVLVYLCLGGPRCQERFEALQRHRTEIENKIKGKVFWEDSGSGWKGYCRIGVKKKDSFSWTISGEEWEPTRQWIFKNLLLLKDAFQQHLDPMIKEEAAADKEE